MNSVLNLILTHQPAQAVARMIDFWSDYVPKNSVLIAYGGPPAEFQAITHPEKVFIDDPRLRTRDHQRELQSYTAIFNAAGDYLRSRAEFEFVHFVEFDHIPLVPDLNQKQVDRLNAEDADILGFHLYRVDRTSNPHFLYHAGQEKFRSFWRQISCRADRDVILSMFGSGSFWRRAAFSDVASRPEPFPIYLEIYLPTLAHHLGYRLRGFGDQNRFVRVFDREIRNIDKSNAWTLHPVKHLWTD